MESMEDVDNICLAILNQVIDVFFDQKVETKYTKSELGHEQEVPDQDVETKSNVSEVDHEHEVPNISELPEIDDDEIEFHFEKIDKKPMICNDESFEEKSNDDKIDERCVPIHGFSGLTMPALLNLPPRLGLSKTIKLKPLHKRQKLMDSVIGESGDSY